MEKETRFSKEEKRGKKEIFLCTTKQQKRKRKKNEHCQATYLQWSGVWKVRLKSDERQCLESETHRCKHEGSQFIYYGREDEK